MWFLPIFYVLHFGLASSTSAQSILPGTYILQLAPIKDFSKHPFPVLNAHVQLFHAAATDIQYKVRYEFNNPDVFLGVSIQVSNSGLSDAEMRRLLRAVPGVIHVTPVGLIESPQPPTKPDVLTFSGPNPLISAANPKLPGPFKGGDLHSTLKMGGVDKLHKLGIKGKGIKIGIIDSGVDYRHPALGGKYGPGNKIAGGYAFVDDSGSVKEKKDPLSTCVGGGHGTHVAGIVSMNSVPGGFDIDGVAPDSTIHMYRVTGCDGVGSTDALIKAMTKAFEDRVDVVSISMGFMMDWDPVEIVSKRLTDEDIPVIVALGNDGQASSEISGLYTGHYPAIESNAIAVGSVANSVFPIVYSVKDPKNKIRYGSVYPIDISGKADLYMMKDGCDEKEWEAAIKKAVKVNSTIYAYILNGKMRDCFQTRREPAYSSLVLKPHYVMELMAPFVRPEEGSDPYPPVYTKGLDNMFTKTFRISPEDGVKMRDAYQKFGGFGKYKLNFDNKDFGSVPQRGGGMMDSFSSFGPVRYTLALKPQISAPGGAILSTWPMGVGTGGYAILDGTSMAAPYISGCFALLKRQFPNETQHSLLSRLQVTARPIAWAYNSSMLAATPQQGAGLVNAYDAIFSKTKISPSQITVKEASPNEYGKANITIENTASDPQEYSFSHRGAGYMNEVLESDELNQLPIYGNAKFTPSKLIIQPGKSVVVHVALVPPKNAHRRKGPLFSGFLVVNSTTLSQVFHIPYIGRPYFQI